MSKERLLFGYKDIVEPRRFNNDAVSYMARHWAPQPAYNALKVLTPTDVKKLALESKRLNIILNDLAVVLKKDRNELQKEVAAMLEEIGMDRKMFVIRWLGIFTIKVLCAMCTSVFVNERNIFKLKSTMGLNPVVFVPSHRSYADFVLMTYLCFCYDIEFPAVAAGMDFHSMVAFGRIMRDTCAFYIRRTFATDKVYSAAFKQYVRTLVTKYHSPISFFIEGTRSRSGKSMAPKYGFMSMILEPLFTREIPDITFVPVSISYDRIMEEKLFAYELLGVPKPKESTSGLLRALSILNENFGSIYVNIGTPFSALDYFGSSFKKSIDALKPIEIRDLSNEENQLIQKLSHEVVHRQQQGMIITSFQLVSVAIMVSIHNEKPMTVTDLEEYVIWLSSILKNFGAQTFDYDSENVKKEITTLLTTHKSFVTIDKKSKVRLLNSMPFLMTDEIKKKMKGHQLSEKTMSTIIPVVMLQLYVNSILHWTLSGLILQHIISRKSMSKDMLLKQYRQMRLLLKAEFPLNESSFMHEFDSSLKNLIDMNVLKLEGDLIASGDNRKVQELFEILFWPFLSCVYRLGTILSEVTNINEKSAIKLVQEKFEWQLLNKEDIHPYCLSLDCIQNCIQGYCSLNALAKRRENNTVMYDVDSDAVLNIVDWLSSLFPQKLSKFYINNPVVMEQKGLLSRL